MDGQEIATLTHPVCLPGDQHCVPHVVVEPGSGPGRPEHGDQSEASIKWCVDHRGATKFRESFHNIGRKRITMLNLNACQHYLSLMGCLVSKATP